MKSQNFEKTLNYEIYKSTESRKLQIYQITKFTHLLNHEKHESKEYVKIQNPEKYRMRYAEIKES